MRRTVLPVLVLLFCIPTDASWLSDRTGINIDLNKQVGTGIAAMGAPTIDAFGQTGQRLIDQMDQKLGARLASITQFTDAEVTRVQGIVTESIRTIDADIEENLNRADEIIEKRLGNVDTIMTKSALTFEGVIRRLLLTGCILVFVAVACWRIYKLGLNWTKLGWEMGGIAVSVVLLLGIFYLLPHSDVNNLISQHMNSYDNSMRVLDFRQARYHAAQLRILDPGNEQYLALDNKATLLQDVLLRPVFY
jgi:hypothetical protein